MTRAYLVRHGTTDWADAHLIHGSRDIPLNERGKQQAMAAAKAFEGVKVDQLYTSTLSRCIQTAEFISQAVGLQPIFLSNLREVNMGWLEGTQIPNFHSNQYGKLKQIYLRSRHIAIRAISGESKPRFLRRILTAWQKVLEENKAGCVVIVAHAGVFGALLEHFFAIDFPPRQVYRLHAASISRVDISSAGVLKLVKLNDTAHLPENLL